MQCLYIVLSGHTTMSDMAGNPMVDAKIMNLLLFCPKLYQLILCPCTNERHLGLCRHLRNIKWPTHFSEKNVIMLSNINWFGLLMYVYVVCIKSLIIDNELASVISFWYHLPDTYLFCVIHEWIFCVVVYSKRVFNIW